MCEKKPQTGLHNVCTHWTRPFWGACDRTYQCEIRKQTGAWCKPKRQMRTVTDREEDEGHWEGGGGDCCMVSGVFYLQK